MRVKQAVKQLIAAALLLCCSSCTKHYGRSEIRDFVKERTGETPKDVSKEPQEIHTDEDEYTDYLWTVTMKDGLVFHVLDDYHWGMEALVNTLRTDYESAVLLKEKDSFPPTSLSVTTTENEGMTFAELSGSYTSRKELLERYEELASIQKVMSDRGGYSYLIIFDHPYRTMDNYESTEADLRGILHKEPLDSSVDERDLLYLCLDHQYACKAEFTDTEITDALEGYTHRIGFRSSEDEPYDFSCPLVSSGYSYGVSFATLYEVLRIMGYSVSGTNDHYEFTDADGNIIEISYSFHHPFEDGREGYYYIRNNEEINMDAVFYNHFTTYQLGTLFGLDVKELWQAEKEQ